jgi:hypothetical protein
MTSLIDDLTARLEEALVAGNTEVALGLLMRFVTNVNRLPNVVGSVLDSPELDAWCERVGALLEPGEFGGEGDTRGSDPQVYVATELYPTGGHSMALRDIIQAQPKRDHHILLTDVRKGANRRSIHESFDADNVTLHWANQRDNLTDRARWLLAGLKHFSRARVFLFTHQEDAVAVAAVMAAQHPRVFFYHHADHDLALGMHLQGSKHIDLSSHSLSNCRDVLGIPHSLYVPLISPPMDPRDAGTFTTGPDSPSFVTCSAGNGGKFERPYLYPYVSMLAVILSSHRGRHVHIGDLNPDYLASIEEELVKNGIDPTRFHYAGTVPNLSEAIAKHSVSLYISSFPVGGAKAAIDVMKSGTPIICHVHVSNAYLGTQCFLYPEARLWRKPDELARHISSSTPESTQTESKQARAFWERHYSPEILEKILDSPDLSTSPAPPEMALYRPDSLYAFLSQSSAAVNLAPHFFRINKLEARLETIGRSLADSKTKAAKNSNRAAAFKEELDFLKSSWIWKLASPFYRIQKSIRKRMQRR